MLPLTGLRSARSGLSTTEQYLERLASRATSPREYSSQASGLHSGSLLEAALPQRRSTGIARPRSTGQEWLASPGLHGLRKSGSALVAGQTINPCCLSSGIGPAGSRSD